MPRARRGTNGRTYEPAPIPLDAFIDGWLKGMHGDGCVVGTNWDANNCGMERPAADLARELVEAIGTQHE